MFEDSSKSWGKKCIFRSLDAVNGAESYFK